MTINRASFTFWTALIGVVMIGLLASMSLAFLFVVPVLAGMLLFPFHDKRATA